MIVMSESQKVEFEKLLEANKDKYDSRFYHWEPVRIKDGTYVLGDEVLADKNFAALKLELPGKVVYTQKEVLNDEFIKLPPPSAPKEQQETIKK